MKIAFIIIKGNSGSDVYFRLLKKSLDEYSSIESKIFYLPSFLEKILFLIPFYLKKINLEGYDFVHTNAEFGCYFKIEDKKLFITLHHSVFDKEYQMYTSIPQKIFHYLWIKPNLKKSLIVADKIIAVSDYTKNSIKKYFKFKGKIKVIYNGIDTDFFKPRAIKREDKKNRLFFVGNPTKRKGFDLLYPIMEELGRNYELYFTSGLRKIKKMKISKNMFGLGKLEDKELLKEYNKCDIFLFPTRLEGFGYVVAEAMACKKPVITTDYSSLPEIIKNKKNGFLCKINDVTDFVKKIKILSKNKNLCKSMGINNRQKIIKKFCLKIMGENYKNEYNKI